MFSSGRNQELRRVGERNTYTLNNAIGHSVVYAREGQMSSHTGGNASIGVDLISWEGWILSWVCDEEEVAGTWGLLHCVREAPSSQGVYSLGTDPEGNNLLASSLIFGKHNFTQDTGNTKRYRRRGWRELSWGRIQRIHSQLEEKQMLSTSTNHEVLHLSEARLESVWAWDHPSWESRERESHKSLFCNCWRPRGNIPFGPSCTEHYTTSPYPACQQIRGSFVQSHLRCHLFFLPWNFLHAPRKMSSLYSGVYYKFLCSLFRLQVLVCAWVCECACTWVECACGGQRTTLGVAPQASSTFILSSVLEIESLFDLELS